MIFNLARIFNAATALNKSVAELTSEVDSVSFCLSKGLSAPSGSLLCGKKEFIDSRGKISNYELTEPINLIGYIESIKGSMRANH